MLSDAALKAYKPTEKVVKLSDGGGLQLWVNPSGSKTWVLAYRDVAGRQRKLTIGPYPAISLKDARKAREDAKALIAKGIDPAAQKRVDKIQRAITSGNTFEAVASDLLARKERDNRSPVTLAKNRWLLDFAIKDFGKRPIAELSAAEVLGTLQRIERRGHLESATRLRALVGQVFRHAIATARATVDPTIALRGAIATPKVKNRAAITDPVKFGALLRAIDGFDGQPTTRAALQLMALLFPRPGELRRAEWGEFDFDKAVWNVPAGRAKMRRPHQCPLPRQAVAILADLRQISGDGPLVFPGYGTMATAGKPLSPRPISENTMNAAIRRLGFGADEMTSHGFRATASTLLNESRKFSADAIERALAHVDEDEVRRTYNRGALWDERVAMAQWWADHLDTLRKGADVISISDRRKGG